MLKKFGSGTVSYSVSEPQFLIWKSIAFGAMFLDLTGYGKMMPDLTGYGEMLPFPTRSGEIMLDPTGYGEMLPDPTGCTRGGGGGGFERWAPPPRGFGVF